jgi:hypothetical protein
MQNKLTKVVWYCTKIQKASEVSKNAQAYMEQERNRANEKAIAMAVATA